MINYEYIVFSIILARTVLKWTILWFRIVLHTQFDIGLSYDGINRYYDLYFPIILHLEKSSCKQVFRYLQRWVFVLVIFFRFQNEDVGRLEMKIDQSYVSIYFLSTSLKIPSRILLACFSCKVSARSEIFWGRVSSSNMGGHNLHPMVEIGFLICQNLGGGYVYKEHKK